MKKRVLIHSLIFNPDGVSTAYLYGDIASALKKAGYDVIVLTTTPHYNRVESQIEKQKLKWKLWGVLKQSDFNGIKVLHVPQRKFKSTLLRLFGFVYWHIVSFASALFIKNVDVILSPSPPLTIGLINTWLGKIKRAKVVYNVQEVYPDILGKTGGIMYSVLSAIEKSVYNNSDAVTTIDGVFYNTIIGRFNEPDKLHVIPNFVDTDLYRPLRQWPNLDSTIFIDNGHLKLLYAGNIGMAQDWPTLIETAKRTKGTPIDYYVIGEGMMKDFLVDEVKRFHLDNVHILPYQPRELMPEILAFSDIQYIFMEPLIAAQGFPSKVYTIMAAGKPLIVCSPENTPIINFLKSIGCAKLVCESDVSRKADIIADWLGKISKEELIEMGNRGTEEVRTKYSKEIVTRQYCELINNL